MFTTRTTYKDKEKFVRWYKRLNTGQREFILRALAVFLEEDAKDKTPINPYLKKESEAEEILKRVNNEGIRRITITNDFKEIIMEYPPFTYSEGPSIYWQNDTTQNYLINE